MTRPHPASLICLWLALLWMTTMLAGLALLAVAGGLLLGAGLVAPTHLLHLLRRSRWLLLILVFLFGWMTPGTPIEYLPGASREGLQLGAEQAARLLTALSSLALMLKALTMVDLVVGMRALFAPLALAGIDRDRIAVRVALTLETVENRAADVAPEGKLHLPSHVLGMADVALAACSLILIAIPAWP